MDRDPGCIFCRIIAGELPSVPLYEDETTLCFMDANPTSDGHCLVVPKIHAQTLFDIPEPDLLAVMKTARKVAMAIKEVFTPSGLVVYQLNGRAAGQAIDHLHVHLVPRWVSRGLDLTHGIQPGDREKIRTIGKKIAAALPGKGKGVEI
jgi:histidine triad (HIT) family protein